MHGLPMSFDFDVLCGRTLDLVSFTAYQVNLSLSENCLLKVEGSMSLNLEQPLLLPASLAILFPLIGHTVQRASSVSAGTLSLEFENTDVLHIQDSSTQFESYSITLDAKELVIV